VGQLLPPHRPLAHPGPQNVEIAQEFHHYQGLSPLVDAVLSVNDISSFAQEFLRKHSAVSLRIFCLGVPFNSDVDFNADRMREAENIQGRFVQFFSNVVNSLVYITEKTKAEAEKNPQVRLVIRSFTNPVLIPLF